jgi:hypothetical protein
MKHSRIQGALLICFDCNNTLWSGHLHCSIDNMDVWHEFQEERPPEDAVVFDVESCDFKRQHLLVLVISQTTRHLHIDAPNRGGWLAWNNIVEGIMHGVRSVKLRPISINVFLMMRLSEAPLSMRVLATLCRPIRSLTTKGKFRLDNFVVGWSSGPNEMSTLDHFIHRSGSMRWAKLISLSSFFPCVFEAMYKLPPKITLISSIWSSLSVSARWCSTQRGSCAAWGDGIFLRSRKVLHSSRSCPEV